MHVFDLRFGEEKLDYFNVSMLCDIKSKITSQKEGYDDRDI